MYTANNLMYTKVKGGGQLSILHKHTHTHWIEVLKHCLGGGNSCIPNYREWLVYTECVCVCVCGAVNW